MTAPDATDAPLPGPAEARRNAHQALADGDPQNATAWALYGLLAVQMDRARRERGLR